MGLFDLEKGDGDNLRGRAAIVVRNETGSKGDGSNPLWISRVTGANAYHFCTAIESIGHIDPESKKSLLKQHRESVMKARKHNGLIQTIEKEMGPKVAAIHVTHEMFLRDIQPVTKDFYHPISGEIDADITPFGQRSDFAYCADFLDKATRMYFDEFRSQLLERRLGQKPFHDAIRNMGMSLKSGVNINGAYVDLLRLCRDKPYAGEAERLGEFLGTPQMARLYLDKIRAIAAEDYEKAGKLRDRIEEIARAQSPQLR
jgi:hypothetical protein